MTVMMEGKACTLDVLECWKEEDGSKGVIEYHKINQFGTTSCRVSRVISVTLSRTPEQ